MAWVAVDAYDDEYIFKNKPKRDGNWWVDYIYEPSEELGGVSVYHHNSDIRLPKGSIKKLIGRDLTWENEPVELKEDTIEKITIDVEDYRRFLSYANYIQNWAGTIYKCPRCGALNPEGYNCMECGYMKLSYE